MHYRYLGRSGLQVSVIGLGGNNFGSRCDAQRTAEVIAAAKDAGINAIDTADIYGTALSEEYVGQAIAGDRDHWVVMTKFAMPINGDTRANRTGASRGYIRKAVVASLQRLGTDYIDLYQVHQPDRFTPAEETMSALNDLVREGLVRYIGCSNYPAWMIAQANEVATRYGWTPFVSAQPQYSLLQRASEQEVIPACEHYGLGVIPWGPLASGFLTGKYRRDEPLPAGTRLGDGQWGRNLLTDRNFDILEGLEAIAEAIGIPVGRLATAWVASRPAVSTVIAGATRPEQVSENAAAADVTLDAGVLAQIDELTRRR